MCVCVFVMQGATGNFLPYAVISAAADITTTYALLSNQPISLFAVKCAGLCSQLRAGSGSAGTTWPQAASLSAGLSH